MPVDFLRAGQAAVRRRTRALSRVIAVDFFKAGQAANALKCALAFAASVAAVIGLPASARATIQFILEVARSGDAAVEVNGARARGVERRRVGRPSGTQRQKPRGRLSGKASRASSSERSSTQASRRRATSSSERPGGRRCARR